MVIEALSPFLKWLRSCRPSLVDRQARGTQPRRRPWKVSRRDGAHDSPPPGAVQAGTWLNQVCGTLSALSRSAIHEGSGTTLSLCPTDLECWPRRLGDDGRREWPISARNAVCYTPSRPARGQLFSGPPARPVCPVCRGGIPSRTSVRRRTGHGPSGGKWVKKSPTRRTHPGSRARPACPPESGGSPRSCSCSA